MTLPDRVLLVARRARDGLVRDVGEEVVRGRRVRLGVVDDWRGKSEYVSQRHAGAVASNVLSFKSRPRKGKLTIVGFFSSTKLFFVNRL